MDKKSLVQQAITMNESQVPNPDLENVAVNSDHPQVSAPNISHGVNPVSSQYPTQPAQPIQPAEPITSSSTLTGKSIFIIEDERFISELYTRALEKAGYKVSTASDGEEALGIAKSSFFDLILLDIMLPTMNGVEILHSLKNNEHGNATLSKIIITTNMDQKEETKAKVESMADGYLIKAEVTPKELVEYVNQVLMQAV